MKWPILMDTGPLVAALNRRVRFHTGAHTDSLSRLVRKYADVPMSLADACLVRMSESHEECVVVTIDGDFRVYRRNGRLIIPTLMPSD